MKKILFVSDTFIPLVDGVARFTADSITSLSKEYEIKLITPDYGLGMPEYRGAKIRYFPIIKAIKIKAGHEYHPSLPNLGTLVSEAKKADVVFVQSLPFIGAMSILAAKQAKKPVVLYFHQIGWEQLRHVIPGPGWFKDIMKRLALINYRFLCNKCDMIIAPSEEIKDVIDQAKITAKKSVVKLGVDTDRFLPAKSKAAAKKLVGIPSDKIVIGYCGRMSDEKDVPTLIKAFNKLSRRRKNLILMLVGGGAKFDKYIENNKNVRITGFVSDPTPFYQAMDVFVMPSLTETTGLSTLEAMSCGVPVVTTPVGVALTSISNGYNGFIFARGDVNALAKQLNNLLYSKKLMTQLSKNGRKYVVDNYSWDQTIRQIKGILDRY